MSFEYQRQDPGPDWHPVGAGAENPDRPLFHGDNYTRLSKRYLAKMMTDAALAVCWQERRERGEGDCRLAFPNFRRAALGQPLFSREATEEQLVAHLMACSACQRQVELLREAIREEERGGEKAEGGGMRDTKNAAETWEDMRRIIEGHMDANQALRKYGQQRAAEARRLLTAEQIGQFLDRLTGPDGCDFRDDGTWTCGGGRDQSRAAAILTQMGIDPQIAAGFLGCCTALGGTCSCEILFNAASHLGVTP